MSSEVPSVIKGSCYCKGIRYQLLSGTAQWNLCHCSMCRKLIGADNCTFIAVPNSKLQMISGDSLKTYRSSTSAERSFCSNCGCSVFMKYDDEPNTIWITAGTLDCKIPMTNVSQTYVENKAYWLDSVSNAPDLIYVPDCAKDL